MYLRVLAMLAELDRGDTAFAHEVRRDLGDVAMGLGESGKAKEFFEAALEGMIRVVPDRWDDRVVSTQLRLIDAIRSDDPAAAGRRIEVAIGEATGAGAGEQAERMRKQGRKWGLLGEEDDPADSDPQ